MSKAVKLTIWFALWLSVGAAFAQNTNVSGTITDSDSSNWISITGFNTTVTFNLVNANNPVTNPRCSGTPMTSAQQSVQVVTNGSGAFTGAVCDVANVTPVNSQWQISICPAITNPCQVLPPTNITGASQVLTTFINANIIAPRLAAYPTSIAFADVEIQPTPNPGNTYYNVTLGQTRVWNGSAWAPLSSATALLSSNNTWTGTNTFNNTVNVNATMQVGFSNNIASSNGTNSSWAIAGSGTTGSATFGGPFLDVMNGNSTTTAFAYLSARSSNSLAGLYLGNSFANPNPVLVRLGGSGTAGTGLTDAAASDVLLILQSSTHLRIGQTGTNSTMQINGTNVTVPSLKSTTGTRYICSDTSGNLTSSATACSGT